MTQHQAEESSCTLIVRQKQLQDQAMLQKLSCRATAHQQQTKLGGTKQSSMVAHKSSKYMHGAGLLQQTIWCTLYPTRADSTITVILVEAAHICSMRISHPDAKRKDTLHQLHQDALTSPARHVYHTRTTPKLDNSTSTTLVFWVHQELLSSKPKLGVVLP